MLCAMPSLRHSSAILASPRRPSSTMRIFSLSIGVQRGPQIGVQKGPRGGRAEAMRGAVRRRAAHRLRVLSGGVSGAVFEAPGVVAGLEDVAVVGETVEQRSGHLGIPE